MKGETAVFADSWEGPFLSRMRPYERAEIWFARKSDEAENRRRIAEGGGGGDKATDGPGTGPLLLIANGLDAVKARPAEGCFVHVLSACIRRAPEACNIRARRYVFRRAGEC